MVRPSVHGSGPYDASDPSTLTSNAGVSWRLPNKRGSVIQIEESIDFASDRILVTVTGDGPDIVLVPGTGASPKVWAPTIAALSGYRYHLMHINGFAGAPALANGQGPIIAPVADEIARYIATARLDAPPIAGHSLGGSIALTLAARHPAMVGRVMVIDMIPFLGEVFVAPGGPVTIEAAGHLAAAMAADTRGLSPEVHAAQTQAAVAAVVRDESQRALSLAESLASDRTVMANAFSELIATDLQPLLPCIAVPVTVLHVTLTGVPFALHDSLNDEIFRRQYSPLQGVVLKRISNSSHFIMADTPARFQAELAEFIGGRAEGDGYPRTINLR